ncbi:hypothetical protein ACIRJR_14135 [Streptomyces sp. NPDC102402]|uniref:hypothetical protein n=1 Tax=Streptomyces sp. NPDC102402 TaxID=3366169 RepID=UPI0038017173
MASASRSAQCAYACDWIAAKFRWNLTLGTKGQAAPVKRGRLPGHLVECEVAP